MFIQITYVYYITSHFQTVCNILYFTFYHTHSDSGNPNTYATMVIPLNNLNYKFTQQLEPIHCDVTTYPLCIVTCGLGNKSSI